MLIFYILDIVIYIETMLKNRMEKAAKRSLILFISSEKLSICTKMDKKKSPLVTEFSQNQNVRLYKNSPIYVVLHVKNYNLILVI